MMGLQLVMRATPNTAAHMKAKATLTVPKVQHAMAAMINANPLSQ